MTPGKPIDPVAVLRAVARLEGLLREVATELLVDVTPRRYVVRRRRLATVQAELELLKEYAHAAAQIGLPLGESTGARRTGGLYP